MPHSILYWFQERLRDAWLWPFNLLRDFPARSGRLLTTVFVGARAILKLPVFVLQILQDGDALSRLWPKLTAWLHLFLVQLFDLVGGPEICQFVMHLGMQTTPLTPGEVTAVQSIFGRHNLRYQDVRIAEGGILDIIFRYNGGLAFATWYTIHLPRVKGDGAETAVSSRSNRSLLVHELTHIFQYHHVGSRYLGEAIYYLVTTKRDCYEYGGADGLQTCWREGKCFSHFNREQQAQIIQDYFTATMANQDVSAYSPYVVQLQQKAL